MEVKGVAELLGSTELGGVGELSGGPELRWRSGVRRCGVTVYGDEQRSALCT